MDAAACAHACLSLGAKSLGAACVGMCGSSLARRQTALKSAAPPAKHLTEQAEVASPTLLALPTSPLKRQVSAPIEVPRGKCTPAAPSPVQQDSGCKGLLEFFRSTGTDSCGRSMAELLAMDFDAMERTHDYIQWWFPTDEASKFNPDAPMLTPELQKTISEDPALREVLRRSLARFCEFLGLELQLGDDGSVAVVEAAYFFDRWDVCWKGKRGKNHNWLRISRVLVCLGRCGLFKEQEAFYKCIEKLYADGVPCGSAAPVWRERALTRPAFA